MKKNVLSVIAVGATFVASAAPMIDTAHDRVQTTLDPKLERIGTLVPRSVTEIGSTHITIGCEMLPRGYGDFENFKEYMPPLGIARVRIHAGWAKLEPKPGEWDFEWLDRQVNWLFENGLEPLLETSYGNPCYKGAGGASLSDGLPQGEEGLAAWDRYVEKLATHYPQVKNWACWNEPNNISENTAAMIADNNIRTARIIKKHIPDAKIGMFHFSWPDAKLTEECLKIMKSENALELFTWALYHDYSPNPDTSYENGVLAWADLVHRYAPHIGIWNGESGATSQPHFSAPISSGKWNSELTQAKWDARRVIGDLGHGIDSMVFTMYDPCYESQSRYNNKMPVYWVSTRPGHFMKRMGLVKCNDKLEVVKVKDAYYTMQNVATVFDSTVEPAKLDARLGTEFVRPSIGFYKFRQKKTDLPFVAFWKASDIPSNENIVQEVTISTAKGLFKDPVWVDMVTGAIYELPKSVRTLRRGREEFKVPMYDAPTLLAEREMVLKANR